MGMWSEVACLLEDWAPPQDWRQVEVTPEAVGVALGIVSWSSEKQSAREAAGTVGWLLFTVFKKSIEEKGMLLKKIQEMVAQELELQTSVDSLKKEMALMREEAARERQQRGAIEEAKTIKEKDRSLQKPQEAV